MFFAHEANLKAAPRSIELKEFGCTSNRRAVADLAKHAVLRKLSGHPGDIFAAAQMLKNDVKMDDLLRQLEEQEGKVDMDEEPVPVPVQPDRARSQIIRDSGRERREQQPNATRHAFWESLEKRDGRVCVFS